MRLTNFFAVAVFGLLIASPISAAKADACADIRTLLDRYAAAVKAKDVDTIMKLYVPDDTLRVFDVFGPREYVGAAAYRKDWEDFLAAFREIKTEITSLKIESNNKFAYSHNIERWNGIDIEGKKVHITVRVTDIYKKIKGRWLIVHEHNSVPADFNTGKADFDSKP